MIFERPLSPGTVRCGFLLSSRPREPVQREPPEGCLEVFVDLLFSDFTPVAIIFLVYVVLYALYHFHG